MRKNSTSPEVRSSALERAKRTLLPALGVDVAIAAAFVVNEWVLDADLASGADWRVLGLLVAKSAITAVAAYVLRFQREPQHG